MKYIIILLAVLIAGCSIYTGQEDWDYHTPCDYTFQSIDELETWILTQLEPVDDIDQYGQSDYWATPGETLAGMKGDCDDRAILFMYLARENFGYNPSLIVLHNPNGDPGGHIASTIEEFPGRRFLCGPHTIDWTLYTSYNYGQTMWIAQYNHGVCIDK
jgi:hypothetical protein